jgi:hypothetical protein
MSSTATHFLRTLFTRYFSRHGIDACPCSASDREGEASPAERLESIALLARAGYFDVHASAIDTRMH